MGGTGLFIGLIFSILWTIFFIYLYYNPLVLRRAQHTAVTRLNRAARQWLLRHDTTFQYEYISHEVVRRREAARANGASQDELDRIDIFSVARSCGINI
jgi:hypothetical protein